MEYLESYCTYLIDHEGKISSELGVDDIIACLEDRIISEDEQEVKKLNNYLSCLRKLKMQTSNYSLIAQFVPKFVSEHLKLKKDGTIAGKILFEGKIKLQEV